MLNLIKGFFLGCIFSAAYAGVRGHVPPERMFGEARAVVVYVAEGLAAQYARLQEAHPGAKGGAP